MSAGAGGSSLLASCSLGLTLLGGGGHVFMALAEAVSTGECTDLHGRRIPHGIHYVPGPDACTLCVCDNGGPKLCKAVLCSPPQDCKTFIMGNFCCEFICLDNTLPVPPTSDGGNGDSTADLGLRLVASGVTAILSLSLLFFLIHRLRQRRIRGRQNRQLHEDQRSLGSVGYITGSIGYLPGSVTCLQGQERVDFLYDEPSSHYSWWKPPENYFPRGEAPPPYEEAVAAAQAEAAAAQAAAPACASVEGAAAEVGAAGTEEAAAVEGAAANQPAAVPTTTVAFIEESSGATAVVHAAPAPLAGEASSLLPDPAATTPEGAAAPSPLLSTTPLPPPLPTQIPPPPSVLANSSPAPLPSTSTNLTAMNDLNKSNCSCVDDNDDYRSECENCKSARGSRYLDEPNITPHETMTLHRRPPGGRAGGLAGSVAHGYRTSLTLPSQARRHREGALLSGGAREAAVQRFSLQLVLDWSDSSSSSLTLSPERRTASPSSSSSSDTSSDINTHI